MDGQNEIMNRTFTTLLRSLVHKSLNELDFKLPHAQFAYNRASTYATKHSLLKVIDGFNPSH